MKKSVAQNKWQEIGLHAPFRGGCPTDPTKRVGHTGATIKGTFCSPEQGRRINVPCTMHQ